MLLNLRLRFLYNRSQIRLYIQPNWLKALNPTQIMTIKGCKYIKVRPCVWDQKKDSGKCLFIRFFYRHFFTGKRNCKKFYLFCGLADCWSCKNRSQSYNCLKKTKLVLNSLTVRCYRRLDHDNTGGPRYSRFCYSRFWLFTDQKTGENRE